jgi:hypothetical protein
MPFVNFPLLQDLSPAAFKLYVYFLDQVQKTNTAHLARPMVALGYESGLQPPCPYKAFRHGKDRQLRNALNELIEKGLIEKQGQRGRAPNAYTVIEHQKHENPYAERSAI